MGSSFEEDVPIEQPPRPPTQDQDPELVYQVQRTGVFTRLVHDQRIGLLEAERWLRDWEEKAEHLGRPRMSQGFWDEGWRWITGELALKDRHEP
jgi:hypothetical protein